MVSADRKYVTLDFRPAMTSATFFTDIIVAPRVGLAVDDPLNPGIVLLPLANYPIELPNLRVREAATTLTVPDRASALIGGFSHDLEQSSDSRVPFLGNIPYLGRLFGRRGRYSEHEKLYLLATITIISYDEQEAKL
jgi:Flp pilus assembly secretin CpaC